MAYADPQTVTINAVPHTLARTGMDNIQGTFRKDDGAYELVITQNDNGRRQRQAVRLNAVKNAPDALNPLIQKAVSMSITLVVDTPSRKSGGGYTNTEKKQIADAVLAWATASSGAQVTKLLGGEL